MHRRRGVVVIAAVVVAALALGGSAFAGGRFDAQNAARVDGFRAVGAGASLGTAAGKLVATRASGPGAGTFAPQFLGSVVQGRGTLQSYSLRLNDGGHHALFAVPGVVDVSITCSVSTGQFVVHFDNEHVAGEISYHTLGSLDVSGGTLAMSAGSSGAATIDTFSEMFLTIRAGFGATGHLATATLDLVQPNSHACWVTGRAIRT